MIGSIGRLGSSSEYTLFGDDNNFIHQGRCYHRDIVNGRCYKLVEPGGVHSRLEREGGIAHRRISAKLFASLLIECKAKISHAAKREATS